jgi:hypothetical protein
MSDIVDSLLKAGLRLEYIHEFRSVSSKDIQVWKDAGMVFGDSRKRNGHFP